jgi:SAM-dependent methyltransferase
MDLPGIGVIRGTFDFRDTAACYLGNVDFQGKRVLEIGPATGFFTYYMEAQGAEVVSVDLSPDDEWDVVPYAGGGAEGWEDYIQQKKLNAVKISNAWWYCHKRLNSKAKRILSPVYDIPQEVGMCDIATVCAVLLHFRDPFLALRNTLRYCSERVIVTDLDNNDKWFPKGTEDTPLLRFVPRAERCAPYDEWWRLNPLAVKEFLRVLGFEIESHTFHTHKKLDRTNDFYTIVAKRIHPPV